MFDVDSLVSGPSLYVTTLPTGQQFAYRLLTMKEYKVFHALRMNQVYHRFILYDKVFKRCYVGNPDYISDHLPAGFFISIGELIMWLSGDSSGQTDKQDLLNARNSYGATSLTEHMKHIVYTAFPSYTIEDVDSWSRTKLFERFVIAEAVLQKRNGYEPIDIKHIMSPEELAESNKKKAAVDYRRENQEMNKAMGDREHILDQAPSVLQSRMQKHEKISKAQARRLDKIAEIERNHRR